MCSEKAFHCAVIYFDFIIANALLNCQIALGTRKFVMHVIALAFLECLTASYSHHENRECSPDIMQVNHMIRYRTGLSRSIRILIL